MVLRARTCRRCGSPWTLVIHESPAIAVRFRQCQACSAIQGEVTADRALPGAPDASDDAIRAARALIDIADLLHALTMAPRPRHGDVGVSQMDSPLLGAMEHIARALTRLMQLRHTQP
ncbi:MAG: hypothetical protein DMF89_07440 [Acidobacteria bacterium]|nr:MAG: hypothetical protein DMF89_07440 [Acidobacteriota bacterium]